MTDTETNGPILAPFVVTWILGWFTGAVHAAVAMKGWEWFVADTFGVRTLSLVEAWGLGVLISFATINRHSNSDDRSMWQTAGVALVGSLILSGLFFLSLVILAGFR